MTEIVIFPCGAGEPTAHYRKTVSPATRTVDLERHADVLDAGLLAELRSRYPDLRPALWGSIPAKRDVWQNVGLGDVAFFYRTGGLFAWGPITHTLRSAALAERLWGRNSDGETWEYIYVLGAVHEPDPPIPFERLTTAAGYDMRHPLGTMVVRRGDNQATLHALLGTTPAAAGVGGAGPSPDEAAGSPWSDRERELLVRDYFEMLKLELRGEKYSKAEHRRALRGQLLVRTDASIEFKHQNVSAALAARGLPRIVGYLPAANYQSELDATIDQLLADDDELATLITAVEERKAVEQLEQAAADLLANPRKEPGQGFVSDVRRRRAIEMRAVEAAIEHFQSLRYQVKDVGTTESYDLRCTRDGTELHVEVKGTTTAGGFVHLTKNEVLHAREYPDVTLFVLSNIVATGDGKAVTATGGVPHLYDPWEIQQGTLVATAYRYELPTEGLP